MVQILPLWKLYTCLDEKCEWQIVIFGRAHIDVAVYRYRNRNMKCRLIVPRNASTGKLQLFKFTTYVSEVGK